MINMDLKSVKTLFNKKAILTPAEKFVQRVLGQFGAYTRAVMRNSIKAAKSDSQHAAPGAPPLSHTGPVNFKNTIFYIVDGPRKQTVIGAILLSTTAAAKAGSRPIPGLLEEGGPHASVRSRAGAGRRRSIGEIAAHPYAAPAFEKALKKKLPELIKAGLRKEA